MDVLCTGGHGLLGRFVERELAATPVDLADADVCDLDAVLAVVRAGRPKLVVHCAAMTDVDACERDPDRAFAVNARGAGNVALAAAEVGAPVVAVSTDFVFDGASPRPYTERDRPSPVQVYGESKLAGERLVADANPRHLIVRTSWLYGPGGKNFISRLASASGRLRAVRDQLSSPTYAPDLVHALAGLVRTQAWGLYHVTNAGAATIPEVARHAGFDVEEIAWADLGLPARRPARTVLANEAMAALGLPALRAWTEALDDYLGKAAA